MVGKWKKQWRTRESLYTVTEYLDSKGISYEIREGAKMIWIYTDASKKEGYQYFYTTGRWCKRAPTLEEFIKNGGYKGTSHKQTKGIKQFVKERKITNGKTDEEDYYDNVC